MNIDNLISECTAYDFKLMLEEKKPKSWLKSVSAFANGLGGSLFFGIDNDGIIKGLVDVQPVCEAISIKIRDYMDPLPDVEIIPHNVEGVQILQLKVNEGHYTPYYYVGDGQRVAFVRMGDESIPATDEDMKRLVLKGTNRSYDSLQSNTLVEKSSFVINVRDNEIVANNEVSNEQVVIKQSLSSHQVVVKLSLSIPKIGDLLKNMITPMAAKDMRYFCGQKDSTYFKANVIDPLMKAGLVAMTHPDSPKSPTQKYYLTDLGKTVINNETNMQKT